MDNPVGDQNDTRQTAVGNVRNGFGNGIKQACAVTFQTGRLWCQSHGPNVRCVEPVQVDLERFGCLCRALWSVCQLLRLAFINHHNGHVIQGCAVFDGDARVHHRRSQ